MISDSSDFFFTVVLDFDNFMEYQKKNSSHLNLADNLENFELYVN
jgi:hypothetical protein